MDGAMTHDPVGAPITTRARAYVSFVVASRSLSAAELVECIGEKPDRLESHGEIDPARRGGRPSEVSIWILEASRAPYADVMDQLDELESRVVPMLESIRSLARDHEVSVILRIVHYMRATDDHGHGIALGDGWIQALAALHGDVDIDQYVEGGDLDSPQSSTSHVTGS